MAQDFLHYDRMVRDAMVDIVRRALSEVAEKGLPGGHHFYISFATRHPAVVVPAHLMAQYPDVMTIVLQHQFYGLDVYSDHFEVTLSFNRVQERLHVPFAAMTAFSDPSVGFGLNFSPDGGRPAPAKALGTAEDGAADAPSAPAEGNVVQFDRFRKK